MNHANASAPPALNGLGVLPWLPNAIIVGVGMAGLLGCEGSQSALDPVGIEATDKLKPGGVQMPHFGMLPPDELRAIAAYLKSLE
jgi:hypothetical protein